MFKNPSFLFDILCTAAWIVLTVRYARKGFPASMVQLLGNGLSLLGAHQLSSACAGWVFEHLLAGGFRTQIAASLAAGGVVDLTGIADKYAGFLPQSFRASIVAACERSIGAVLSDNAVVLADTSRELAARTSGSTTEISSMIAVIQGETRQAIDSMDATRDRAAQGVELANQAGTVILQIREGTGEAVQAVSAFANERGNR